MYLERSTKGGAWGSWITTGLPSTSNDEGLFYPPVEVSGSVVVKASNTVYVSRTRGTPGSWAKINLPGTRLATALSLPDKKTILVGTDDGRMYKITFSSLTNTWTTVTLATPRAGYVSDIISDPDDSDIIWATYSNVNGGHVFRSDDDGGSWADVSSSLPNIPVNSIELDPSNTDTVFVAADVGVYRSDDAGLSWNAFSLGLPNALAKDLLFHPESRLLRVATKSRGIWEIQVDSSGQPEVAVFVRDNVIDSGRVTPSPSSVDNPYSIGEQVFWWESPDIKIDSPSYQSSGIDGLDFEIFEDDQSMIDNGIEFSAGLQSESIQAAGVSRVYVQVHNRGVKPAIDVDVRVFFTAASAVFPNLPSGFWSGFPSNTVSANSPWQPVADHRTIPGIAPGRSKIIGFNWATPASFSGQVSLLSFVSAANDVISTTELNIESLVKSVNKCAVKSGLAINPSPLAGPVRAIVPIQIPTRSKKSFKVRTIGKSGLIRGLILSKAVVKREKSYLKKVELTEQDREEILRLVEKSPKLKNKLDLKYAYTCKSKSKKVALLETLKKSDLAEGQLIVVLNRKSRSGSQSLVVENAAGDPIGGFKFSSFNRS